MRKQKPVETPKPRRTLSQGVGESKRFIAPGERDPYQHLRGLHIMGTPVEEVLKAEVAHLFNRDYTDEGIAERNNGKVESAVRVRSLGGERAPVTGTDRDQKLRERRDFIQGGSQIWQAPDAMKELVDRYIQPGMRPRFLSPFKVKKQGTRGFEVVKDEKGEPVTLGELILSQMPEERALARNRFFIEKDRARMQELARRNEKLVHYDRAESFRPIVSEVAPTQSDDSLHTDWVE